MTAAPVGFRAGVLAPALTARGDVPGAVAKRDLDRYYTLLARELETVLLSEAEALLLADATNGTYWEPTTIRLLWAEVSDAIAGDALATKWQLAGDARSAAEHGAAGRRLIGRLRALSESQCYAVVDALERAWRLDEPADMRARLRMVGLVRG